MKHYALFLTILMLLTLLCMTIWTYITFSISLNWHRSRNEWNLSSGSCQHAASDSCQHATERKKRFTSLWCSVPWSSCTFWLFPPSVVMTFFDVIGMNYPEEVMMNVSALLYYTSSIFNGVLTLRFKFKDYMKQLICPVSEQNRAEWRNFYEFAVIIMIMMFWCSALSWEGAVSLAFFCVAAHGSEDALPLVLHYSMLPV